MVTATTFVYDYGSWLSMSEQVGMQDVQGTASSTRPAACNGMCRTTTLLTTPTAQGVLFIRSCLQKDEAQRMSISEALAHPWLKEASEKVRGLLRGSCGVVSPPPTNRQPVWTLILNPHSRTQNCLSAKAVPLLITDL